jgi:Tol biopolymer transport system component
MVKVLDFGLAKPLDPIARSDDVANSPTLTFAATQAGVILGTAAYMAPEQARGRAVDRRADIWAFGVVLYEMLSGRRAFEGDDVSITLASVLKEEVKWDALPADLPAPVGRLLRRCLEKDPKRRLAAIGDARLELDEAASPAAAASGPRAGLANTERWIWASIAGVATVAAVIFALTSSPGRDTEPLLVRFGVLPPGEGQFSGAPPRFAVSPDGRLLVFAASAQPGSADQLWLRRLDTMEVTPIAGTESGPNGLMPQSPFWSPDGKRLAFFLQSESSGARGESRLRTVELQGGSSQAVCTLPSNNAGGSWNAGGVMLVSSQETKGIQRVPAGGGVPTPVTTLDAGRKEIAHLFPQFLPDGRHFIFQALTTNRAELTTFVGSIDSTERTPLVQTDYARFAAPNQLLYVRDENLVAQVMNPDTRQLTGEPVMIATGLEGRAANGRAGFAVSDTGVLVYSSNVDIDAKADQSNRQLTWLDRRGAVLAKVGTLTSASTVRLSPKATHVALNDFQFGRLGGPAGVIWVTDLERQVKSPLTPASGLAMSPVWSADGTRLLFATGLSASANLSLSISERVASGATPATQVYDETGYHVLPLAESSDGKLLVFSRGQGGRRSLQILSRSDQKRTPYLAGEFDYPQAALSPDDKWLAYVSNESGVYEIIVQPFPDPSRGKWPISTGGGIAPRWRADGRELFYVDGENRLVAVSITGTHDFVPGSPTPLFPIPIPARVRRGVTGAAYIYDAAPDGQRFLVSVATEDAPIVPLTVTTNWTALVKK